MALVEAALAVWTVEAMARASVARAALIVAAMARAARAVEEDSSGEGGADGGYAP